MKISIITPVYKGEKALRKFLESIVEQTSKSYELVFVVDTNGEDVLSVIQEFKLKLKSKIKVVFNSKRTSRIAAINKGASIAGGKYSIINSLGNTFSKTMIETAQNAIKDKKSDIIEFKAKFEAPIKFSGKLRKQFNTPVVIKDNSEVQAFSYPFDFNKIYKTDVLREAAKYKIPGHINSRFSIDTTHLPLLVAETYSTVNKVLVVGKSKISPNFNPLKLVKQWDELINISKNYFAYISTERYEYAQFFSETVFISAFIKASKNKVISKKYNEKYKKQMTTKFSSILETNKYANMISKEHEALSTHTKLTDLPKIHKEIG